MSRRGGGGGFAISFDSGKDLNVRDEEFEFAKQQLGGEIPRFIGWITKLKREKKKSEDRLVVIGQHRVLSVAKSRLGGLSVKRDGHFYALKKLTSHAPTSLTLSFEEFVIEMQTEKAEEVIKKILDILATIQHSFPQDCRVLIDVMPPDRAVYPDIVLEIGGFVEVYRAACSFHNTPVAESVVGVARACAASKELNLSYILLGSDPSVAAAAAAAASSSSSSSLSADSTIPASPRPGNNNNASISPSTATATVATPTTPTPTSTSTATSEGMENVASLAVTNKQHHGDNVKFANSIQINPAADLYAVLYSLRYNTHFTSIRINGVVAKDKKTSIIAQLAVCMEKNRFIQNLTLSALCCGHGFDVFAKSLVDNPFTALVELDLSGNQLKDQGVIQLAEGVANVPLRSLDLSRCGIDSKGFVALAGCLSLPGKALGNSVVALNLSFNRIGKSGSAALEKWLASRVAGDCSLITLLLSNCCVDVSSLCSGLSKQGTAIVILDLAFSKINNDAAKVLTAVLSQTISIQDLDLTGCNISADSVASVARSFTSNRNLNTTLLNLAEIDLSANFAAVTQAFTTTSTLHTLALDDTLIGSRGVTLLLDVLPTLTTLRRLQISRILHEKEKEEKRSKHDKSNTPIPTTTTATQKLAEYLSSPNCQLTALQIGGGKNFQLGKLLVILMSALEHNKSLTEFDCCGQNGGEPAITTMANSIKKNTTLRVLVFDDNNATIPALENFMNGLKNNKTIVDIPYLAVDLLRLKNFINSCKKDKSWENRRQLSYVLQTISACLRSNKLLARQQQQQQLQQQRALEDSNNINYQLPPPPPPRFLDGNNTNSNNNNNSNVHDDDDEYVLPPVMDWETQQEASQDMETKRMTMEATRMTMNINKLALAKLQSVYGAVADNDIQSKIQTVKAARQTMDMSSFKQQQQQQD